MTRLLWLGAQALSNDVRRAYEAALPIRLLRVNSPDEALGHLRNSVFECLLIETATMPIASVIDEALRTTPGLVVIVHHRGASVADAVGYMRLGAFDCLTGELCPEAVAASLARNHAFSNNGLVELAPAEADEPWRALLIGNSPAIRDISKIIGLVASLRSTVLITGETGTGKEVVARALHLAGNRSSKPMISVNCAALPEHLIEAELFGHVKGAFTGAIQSRVGRFEQAQGGTLFLDEIGDMPLALQTKLLRALQEREIQRLGSSETVRVDARVVAASNVDLEEAVKQGRFRSDLFYRLNVVPVRLPPLRERRADIPLLVNHFVRKVCNAESLRSKVVQAETVSRLQQLDWPGNVRQLEHAVESAIALSGERGILIASDFPSISRIEEETSSRVPYVTVPDDGIDLGQTLLRLEKGMLEQALFKTGGNKKQAANLLRMKRSTLHARIAIVETALREQTA